MSAPLRPLWAMESDPWEVDEGRPVQRHRVAVGSVTVGQDWAIVDDVPVPVEAPEVHIESVTFDGADGDPVGRAIAWAETVLGELKRVRLLEHFGPRVIERV
ncbi:hypothetical protein [Demequina capsici]|uniref:Uncharacterized protein n=1 Tax=Demequina capsici TaxID=3075620 RepID=A0AA96FBK9_9MICO|nr:hypothetical protein [Demequina sp. OYTSA14]WNM25280.1 hypothetical protein RN606_03795 [Demequina sp. OYTSA14]